MEEFIPLANQLVDAARTIILPRYRTGVLVEDKADNTPVTVVDRAVEVKLKDLIGAACPHHGFIGEETLPHQPDSDYVWVVDPIDGTKAFLCGIPVFGTLIALTHRGRPVLGVIDQPVNQERWLGVEGQFSTLNGAPIATRTTPELAGARLCATAPEMFAGAARDRFAQLSRQVKMTRYGTDCYGYGLLAAGFVDLVVESDLSPYDYMAHVPIVQGAGGVMTDWHGQALTLECGASQVVAAGNSDLHRAALAVLGE